jgi:hypothetical protein
MDIRDAVRLICNRWLQENDFKYLGRYYGIDQLDSRRSNTFEQVADKFIDRLVDSEEYKEVRKIVANAEQKMAHHLLKMKKNQDQKKECEVALEVAEASNDMPAKDVTKIRKAIMRCEQKQRKLQGKSVVLEQTMVEAVAAQERAIRKSSRKQQLIDGAYDMLDLSRKSCMDALRVNAANIFDKLHERFRANYDNYRDDHEYWRLLTRSSGNVSWDGRRVHIELWLSGTIPPRVLKAMRKTLISIEDDINRISLQPVRIAIVTGMIFQEKQGVQLDTP